eukprot:TRINITY_DN38353_c0_g1_i1.p1 TRINITY_DN38353_c0_g1~~TRINITY_DN38353_c0_g1_i1.p1  ORF type:complete len:417 (-),score=81.01 TRINITY_DN38353_c0_g1_i1:492-1742(-)
MAHVPSRLTEGDVQGQLTTGTSQRDDLAIPLLFDGAVEEDDYMTKYNDPKLLGLSSFEKLLKLHSVPPPTIVYDAQAPLSNLIRISGSGVMLALVRGDFWVLLILHIILSVLYYRTGEGVEDGTPEAPGWPKFNMHLIGIPGGLTTFVLVFYLNQSFGRYISQSTQCFGALGALGEYVQLLRVHFHDAAFPHASVVRHELFKLINALHCLAFTCHPQYADAGIKGWGWYYLLDNKLLTEGQVQKLKPFAYHGDGRLAFREIALWTNRGIWAQQSRGHLTVRMATLFTHKMWQIRDHLEELYTFPSGPVPFAYYHLINFIVLLYLTALSYAFVFIAPVWSIPGFFLILVGLLGIRELGNAMSNPIGEDSMDIPVFHFIHTFLKNSTALINRSPGYTGEIEELTPKTKPLFDKSSQIY